MGKSHFRRAALPTTTVAITALLKADPEIDAATAQDVLVLLRGEEPARPEPTTGGDALLTVGEVARRIGKCRKTVHYLAARGVFKKVAFPGQTRASGILSSSVTRYLVPEDAKEAQ